MPWAFKLFTISCAAFSPAFIKAFFSASLSSNPCDLTWTGPIDATTSGNPSIIWDTSTLILADTVKFPLTLSTRAVFTLMVPIATKPMILLHLPFSAIASKISASVSSVY